MTRKTLLLSTVLLIGVIVLGTVGLVWSGVYNVGADDPHLRVTYSMLETLRERSISARANKLHPPPDLDDPARIRQGAGNYNAMCTGCHLAPGMEPTELSQGLYPAPPNLTEAGDFDASHHFWVIKHGIKASGMPAWGKSMSDEYIWNMAAFLQELPKLDPAQYHALVESSGGHSHGGGESMPHDDGPDAVDGHHDEAASGDHAGMEMPMSGDHPHPPGTPAHDDKPAAPPADGMTTHRHADGTVESHPTQPTPPADDGHDHQH